MNPKKNPESDIVQTLGIDTTSGRRKHLKRRLVIVILALMAMAALILWKTAGNGDDLQYKTQKVQRGNLTITVTATGNLEPTNQVDVGSELSGIIRSVEADYNDRVKVGQVLARLDTDKLQAQVLQSKAALESAKAKVLETQATISEAQNALRRLEKVRELSAGKVPSQQDLDAAQAALERAQAEEANAKAAVSQARATLEVNETDLDKALIRSPIKGIVLTRSVEPGQTVAASLQAPVLFTLAEDLTQMELHVDVDEADVGQVKKGQEAIFTVDAFQNRSFPAQITQVRYGSQTLEGVVTYETVLHVDNSDLSLRPGMTATADITVQKIENAVLVPNAALRFAPPVEKEETSKENSSNGGSLMSKILPHPRRFSSKPREEVTADKKQQQVWTLRDGKLVAIAITTGPTDGILTEVTDGVEPGMALVVDIVGTQQ
jgi:HlyD family secretion protein